LRGPKAEFIALEYLLAFNYF